MHKILTTLCVTGAAVLGSCSAWPGLENPVLTIAPEYTALRMTGTTRMQFGSPLVNGSDLRVSDLGADDREDNVGVKLTYGERGSGLDLQYNRFEGHTAAPGFALDGWGDIPPPSGGPEPVDTRVTMDSARARYIAAFDLVAPEETEWLQFGVGVLLIHRELTFDVRALVSSASQKIEIKDDVSPMVAVRLAGQRGVFGYRIDFAYNDWQISHGEIKGPFYDLNVEASYLLEDQDLTLFAGYRRFDIPADGISGGRRFATDFSFDGYVFGFKFDF